jgi:GT2 family glycosyltransferase
VYDHIYMTASPLFSVIVPTHERPERLAACLEALSKLDFPGERFEVVVSDDGSATPAGPVVARFVDSLTARVVEGPNRGPGTARNRGAASAQGRFLVFLDDDCLSEPGWLAAFARHFGESPDRLIAGGIVNGLPRNPFSTATHLIVSYVYGVNERKAGARLFNSCNLAVPADRFRQLGGFSEAFPLAAGEDYDFCHRWQHAGLETSYAPEAVVRHVHALDLARFCRQHYNYGRGLYLCRRRIARRERMRFRVQSPRFYFGLLTYPMRQVKGLAGWGYGFLALVSQFATLAGALREGLVSTAVDSDSRGLAVEGREP